MNSLESLNNLLIKMRPLLLAVGIPDHQLSIIPKKYKIPTLAKAFDWLHDIYISEIYNDSKIIYNSVPPETWEMYETLGIEDLTEQRLLRIRGKDLINLWKSNRPRLFINRQTEICQQCGEKAIFTYSKETKRCGNCYHESTTNTE